MKLPLLASLALAAGLIVPAAAQTPAVPAAPATSTPIVTATNNATRVNGRVTKVDPASNSVTIQPRRGQTPTTFTVAPGARITVVTPLKVSDLASGNIIRVYAQADIDTAATTVEAQRITVLQKLAKNGKGRLHPRWIEGTVATITPNLTLTTADGKTVTVTTTDRTRVESETKGSFADIQADKTQVQARLTGNNTANEVRVSPARQRRNRAAKL